MSERSLNSEELFVVFGSKWAEKLILFIMAHFEADESSENNKILILHFISEGLSPVTLIKYLWCWESWKYFNILIGLKDYPLSLVMCTRPFVHQVLDFIKPCPYNGKLKHKKHPTPYLFSDLELLNICSVLLLSRIMTVITSVNQNK